MKTKTKGKKKNPPPKEVRLDPDDLTLSSVSQMAGREIDNKCLRYVRQCLRSPDAFGISPTVHSVKFLVGDFYYKFGDDPQKDLITLRKMEAARVAAKTAKTPTLKGEPFDRLSPEEQDLFNRMTGRSRREEEDSIPEEGHSEVPETPTDNGPPRRHTGGDRRKLVLGAITSKPQTELEIREKAGWPKSVKSLLYTFLRKGLIERTKDRQRFFLKEGTGKNKSKNSARKR